MASNPRLGNLRKVIREAFNYFDKVGNATVSPEEIPTIMRYLGQFPSEQEVVEVILREIQVAFWWFHPS